MTVFEVIWSYCYVRQVQRWQGYRCHSRPNLHDNVELASFSCFAIPILDELLLTYVVLSCGNYVIVYAESRGDVWVC